MKWIIKELNNLKKNNLFRRFRIIESACSSTVKYNNKTCLMLASNNYFGLNTHPKVISAVQKTVAKYGSGNVASRLIVNLDLHNKLEKELAHYKQCESAIVYSSGYAANVGVISCVVGKGDLILSDSINHASIIDGCRLSKADVLVYRHCDVNDLSNKLKENRSKYKKILIVTDSVFSMDGDIAPLNQIIELKKKFNLILMVDDAHATGIIDTNFEGIDIHMGTLSKALASQGGYVAGSKPLIDFLRNKSRPVIYSTGLSPADTAAAITSLKIIKRNKKLKTKLLENADYLRKGLKRMGFKVGNSELQIIPLMIGSNNKTMKFQRLLEKEGIFVTGIRPPTVPVRTARLRVVVIATHTRKELDKALRSFNKIGTQLNIIPHDQK